MKVPFHLRTRPTSETASAILLESDRVGSMLGLAAGQSSETAPVIFRIPGGFLLKRVEGVELPDMPTRLRKLAPNLYLPVDADLVPALLDDEAEGLTRDLGLIFLPSGKILGFDPLAALPASSLIEADQFEGLEWQSFPDRPDRPDRIREITHEPPALEDNDPFETEEESTETGTEGRPQPGEAGEPSTLAGQAKVGLGQGLIALGTILGIKALADLGARWIGRAIEKMPRLTEGMLGRQEGALRELLRQFREGEIDQALRHALPMGGQGGRGGFASGEGKLPDVDPTYSLQTLLGAGQGPNGIWFGGFDVQAELIREYRKAAEEAESRGDYKRAAYILGKLLNDYATAAHLLSRGGHHRDAAILYLNRVKDIPAAARAFESAGEVDRALQLYRQKSMHVEAGDLLRKLGESEAAVQEYIIAADALAIASPIGRLAAGDLLRDRAGRLDLAMAYYAQGWGSRPLANAVTCGLRMATAFADRGETEPLFQLVTEADEFLLRPGQEGSVGDFYNTLVTLADHESMVEVRDDLRDRALMGIAAKLRQSSTTSSRPGQLASTYFGRSKAWTAELVSDANHALKGAADREVQRRRLSKLIAGRPLFVEPRRIEVGEGMVSAVCHSPVSGEVFLGFEKGEVYRIDVARGEVELIENHGVPVGSLAIDAEGRTLVILLGDGPGPRQLVYRTRMANSTTWTRQFRSIEGPGDFWLTPVTTTGAGRYQTLGVWNGEELLLMGGVGSLTLLQRLPMSFLKTEPHAALLIPPRGRDPILGTVLIHDGPDVCHVDVQGRMLRRRFLGWRPTLSEGNTLRSVPLAWLQIDPELFELAGLDREGIAHWTSLKITDTELIRPSNNLSSGRPAYFATTLVRAGLVAGVHESGLDWLRCGPKTFREVISTDLRANRVIACVPSNRTGELVVISGDGTLICVPIPR